MLDPQGYGLFLWTVVAFLVTLLVLFKLAWKPLTRRLGRGEATPGASDQVAVRQLPSLGRCPYCHSELSETGVACASCLAKHHQECWDEHGECASCGSVERYAKLERTPGRPRTDPASRPPKQKEQ